MMQARNRRWLEQFTLKGAPFFWDLETAMVAFDSPAGRVLADICVVGTAWKVDETFLWSWANEAIPDQAKSGIHKVREFGDVNDLPLLTTAELPGGRSQGLEALAITGRVLDAEGALVDEQGEMTLFFALSSFRRESDERGTLSGAATPNRG
jgi:hypothetical protein